MKKKVAIALSDKKKKSLKEAIEFLRFDFIFNFRKQDDFEFYEFDLDDASTFVKVDLILHKLTDDMVSQEEKAKKRTQNFMNYLKENPNVILIEDLEKLQKTMDRYKMYKQFREEIPKDIVSIPEFITIEKEEDLLKASTIKFPLICKPFMACGKTGSHEMVITFTEDHLKSIFYDKLISIPFVGQRYINHHSTVHKVYVMGEKTVVKQKFSSKDVKIEKDSKLIQFDSQKEWPSILKTDATELYAPPNEKTVSIISNYLRNFLEMEFLGYDIITETETNLNYLIDVNYFPGYTGVKDFEIELMKYIKKRLKI